MHPGKLSVFLLTSLIFSSVAQAHSLHANGVIDGFMHTLHDHSHLFTSQSLLNTIIIISSLVIISSLLYKILWKAI